jgi:hypothetical protein
MIQNNNDVDGDKMNDALFNWYKATHKMINNAYASPDNSEYIEDVVNEWVQAIKTMDMACPDLKVRYERLIESQSTFTSDQINFICYQIGDWYIEWADKMWVDGKPNQHWLGLAKEQLKTMICGD